MAIALIIDTTLGSNFENYDLHNMKSLALGAAVACVAPIKLQVTGGKITAAATAAGYASINLPHGTAPAAPVNGDVWTTTAGMYVRINGATVGPLT